MATSISTLSYKITADPSQFNSGMGSARQQMALTRKVIAETATSQDKLAASTTMLEGLYRKGNISFKQFSAALLKVKNEAALADGSMVQLGTSTAATTKKTSMFSDVLKGLVAGRGISDAIRLIGDAFRYVDEQTAKAAESLMSWEDSRKKLRQVATGPEDLQRMENTAAYLTKTTGIPLDQARDMTFSGRSEGFVSALPSIARFSSTYGASGAAITAAGQVPGLFPGAGLSPTESLNMAFTASGRSRANFEQLISALPIAASGGDAAGATPSETMAILSVLASRFASPKMAAERMKTLGISISQDPRLKGMGFMQAVAAMEADPAMKTDVIGSAKEMSEIYGKLIQERTAVAARTGLISKQRGLSGTDASEIAQAYVSARDPSTQMGRDLLAVDAANKAAAQREIANAAQYGGKGLGQKTAIDTTIGMMQAGGQSGFVTGAGEWAGLGAKQGSASGGFVAGATIAGAAGARGLGRGTLGPAGTPANILLGLVDVIKDMKEGKEQQKQTEILEEISTGVNKDETVEEVDL